MNKFSVVALLILTALLVGVTLLYVYDIRLPFRVGGDDGIVTTTGDGGGVVTTTGGNSGENNGGEQERAPSELRLIYNAYVQHVESKGGTPIGFEDWLLMLVSGASDSADKDVNIDDGDNGDADAEDEIEGDVEDDPAEDDPVEDDPVEDDPVEDDPVEDDDDEEAENGDKYGLGILRIMLIDNVMYIFYVDGTIEAIELDLPAPTTTAPVTTSAPVTTTAPAPLRTQPPKVTTTVPEPPQVPEWGPYEPFK